MPSFLRDGTYLFEGDPRPLDRALRELQPEVSWSRIRKAITSGKLSVDDKIIRDPRTEIFAGSQIRVRMATPRKPPPPRLAPDAILLWDSQIVVVRKTAGIATVPHDDPDQPNLQSLTAKRIGKRGQAGNVIVVQRLDRDTSGLLVFARTPAAQQHLKQQFGRRTVTRRYLALASGTVKSATLRSNLVFEKDGHGHSVRQPGRGKLAITHIEPQKILRGATLLSCRLETGRTHQIRIHLAEAGHPLLGDRMYTSRRLSPPSAPRVMLHAAHLGFTHPRTGQHLEFDDPLPPDMRELVAALR